MRWLRPTVPHDTGAEAVDDVARSLEAAAHEAPPSHRIEAIREALLADVGANRRAAPGLVPLVLAAGVLLLALVVGVGGPAVGSWIGERLDRVPASPLVDGESPAADPSVTELPNEGDMGDITAPTRGANPSEGAVPSAAPSAGAVDPSRPTPVPAPSPGPVVPAPTPRPGDPGPPQIPPSGPPIPLPTPPVTGPPGPP